MFSATSNLSWPTPGTTSAHTERLLVLSLQLRQQRGDLPGTGGAQRMAQSDGAALRIHLAPHSGRWLGRIVAPSSVLAPSSKARSP